MRHLPSARAVLLLACLVLSSEALARQPLSFSVGYAGQVSTGRAYDLVDEDDHLPMLRLSAGYLLPLSQAKLELEAGFRTGGTSATLHSATTAKLDLRGVELGAAYRFPLTSHVEPYAQALLAYDWLSLGLGPLGQSVGQVSATGLLGLALVFPLSPRDTGGTRLVLDFGVGYGFRPDASFDALTVKPPEEQAESPIPEVPLRVGALPLSGVAYRFQLGLRL